ncbi:MAG: hypothetical protein CVU06_10760 [Bacteroidetes bacterium HGW-Bacteroidetes-22]|nr:MAG: hypothetical protein CVU06_10760 [Bacteroidetes bacterium HGW-Bacteroidetes-22]
MNYPLLLEKSRKKYDRQKYSLQQGIYFMVDYVMNMSILVSNINRCGQKALSFKVRHKAYASRWA